MSMPKAVQEFEQRFEAERNKGMQDQKFCVGDVSTATVESFCAEANRMDEALEQGRYEVHTWDD